MSSDSTTRQPRTIVLCFDGTTDQFDSTNTNVVKFHALLNKRCPLKQIVYYQPGIGTFFEPGVVSPALKWLAKKADAAVAWYIHEHIIGGYKFLMNNYHEGDKICLFGFSRGAFTARSLAAFLYRVGLLPRDNDELLQFAYNLYKRADPCGRELASQFKGAFCTPVVVDFLGVWDTVASVGLMYNRAPPLNSAHCAVRITRHALSLDERRARFQPSMFNRQEPQGTAEGEDKPTTPLESIPPVLEVWFAGCHADVGGGAVENTVPYSLSDISLRWMIKQVYLSQCGIIFDDEALGKATIVPPVALAVSTPQFEVKEAEAEGGMALPTLRASPSSSGEDSDVEHIIQREEVAEQAWVREQDVLSDIHDELKAEPAWWLLEYLPMRFARSKADGRWHFKWGTNRGRPRKIRDEHPIFHESVRQRINAVGLKPKYTPKASWKGKEQYVD